MLPLSAKARGEWAELVFLQEARRRGFQVAKPIGDTAAYDVLLDNGRRIFRVQVKSASHVQDRGYKVIAAAGSRSKRPYTARDIDFLAAYIVPLDLWYIFPARAFSPRLSLWMFPGSHRGLYEPYRTAWHLFGSPRFRR